MTSSSRPRPKAPIVIDPNNAYARLGVSPLMSTAEIKSAILKKRSEVQKQRRARQRATFDRADIEMERLQRIEAEIGVPKKRAAYDAANPQNTLLTVQRAPVDRLLDGNARLDVVTKWLREVLGPDVSLPTPESLAHWIPPREDVQLQARLERHRMSKETQSGADKDGALRSAPQLSVQDLKNVKQRR